MNCLLEMRNCYWAYNLNQNYHISKPVSSKWSVASGFSSRTLYSFFLSLYERFTPSVTSSVLFLSEKYYFRSINYDESLRIARSGNRTPVWARFSASLQTGPGAHPDSYSMGAGSLPGVKRPRRGADYPPHLAPKLKKE
jgi:hypothetical protein